MQFIDVPARDPVPLEGHLIPGRYQAIKEAVNTGRVIHVNSTAAGGGVAEMMRPDVGYAKGLGADWSWGVIDATPSYFVLTKSIHNALHGYQPAEPLGRWVREEIEYVGQLNAPDLEVGPGDTVILHDPQVVGLVDPLKSRGATVLWRCHVGTDRSNRYTEAAWDTLSPFLDDVDGVLFSRMGHVPRNVFPVMSGVNVHVIPPTIDPLSAKNNEAFLPQEDLPEELSIVQVSRWDRLKDPVGLIHSFMNALGSDQRWHLYLVGPETAGVADDPEALEVLRDVQDAKEALKFDGSLYARIHLIELPMEDLTENALAASRLQRRATIIAQHSVEEGFGLVVTEGMWKGKTVVANRVGGIGDQLGFDHTVPVDNRLPVGWLCQPGTNDFEVALNALAEQPQEIHDEMGRRAKERVRYRYLTDSALLNYFNIINSYANDQDLRDLTEWQAKEGVA